MLNHEQLTTPVFWEDLSPLDYILNANGSDTKGIDADWTYNDGNDGLHRVLPTKEKLHLMDYTGINDYNNQPIFEGDIIKMYGGHISVIEWFDGEGSIINVVGFIARQIYRSNKSYIDTADMKSLKREWNRSTIIGNIYQNPEILEK